MLKQVESVLRQGFAQTERFFSEENPFRVFANPAARKDFINRHFRSTDKNVVHYWQPCLMKIDQFVDNIDQPASSVRALLPELSYKTTKLELPKKASLTSS